MPRAVKTSSRQHAPAVSLTKRAFAAPDAVEQVLPGAEPEQSVFSALTASAPETEQKKNRPVFHGAVVAGVASHPYSRSHLRREKRKKADVGGGLSSVALALDQMLDEPEPVPVVKAAPKKGVVQEVVPPQKAKKEADGKIGAGSARTLGERQRRKQITANAARTSMVMAHAAFKANPFATIREHAANSIAKSEEATAVVERKKQEKHEAMPKVRIPAGLAMAMDGIE